MLVVEGSDLVGKTMLCHALIKKMWQYSMPLIYQHFGKLPDSWDYNHDYRAFMNRRVCMDRFIMSEVAYGIAVREGPEITPERYRKLDGWLRTIGTVTVVVVAESDWLERQLKEKYQDRNEMYKIEQILKANETFKQIIDGKTPWTCDYDFVYRLADWHDTMPSSNNEFIDQIIDEYTLRTKIVPN